MAKPQLLEDVGKVSELKTNDKTVVGGINEVLEKEKSNAEQINICDKMISGTLQNIDIIQYIKDKPYGVSVHVSSGCTNTPDTTKYYLIKSFVCFGDKFILATEFGTNGANKTGALFFGTIWNGVFDGWKPLFLNYTSEDYSSKLKNTWVIGDNCSFKGQKISNRLFVEGIIKCTTPNNTIAQGLPIPKDGMCHSAKMTSNGGSCIYVTIFPSGDLVVQYGTIVANQLYGINFDYEI